MRFDICTIFPNIFDSYLSESILGRAQEEKLISIMAHNIRSHTDDKHNTVDDMPYGGGAGMVLKAEPILKTIDSLPSFKKKKIIVFSAKGKQFTQKMAYDWAHNLEQIVMIAGRYEGIDERVVLALDAEEISIGPYVLTDGELPAMIVVSAIARLIPGVITLASLEEESHWNLITNEEKNTPLGQGLEYPHYTRPESFTYKKKGYMVPKILLSGNHAEIEKWRSEQRKKQ